MPDEWPLAAHAADRQVDAARLRGRRRLSTVRMDFFLDPADRLTEQERALMTAMLHDLVATLANEIAFSAGMRGFRAEPASLAATLSRTGLADRPDLISLMLRRADEYRASGAYARQSGPRRLPLLPKMVSDSSPVLASAAMSLVVARGRRVDGFGQPRLELADLTRTDRLSLAQAVAAMIVSEPVGDQELADAAARVSEAANDAKSLDQVTDEFVAALDQAGRDSDLLVEESAAEGEVSLLAHILSRRAGIEPQAAWQHLTSVGDGAVALLARMANLPRPVAARLIADLGASSGTAAIAQEIERFDMLDAAQVSAAQRYWQLPADYRAAQERLDG